MGCTGQAHVLDHKTGSAVSGQTLMTKLTFVRIPCGVFTETETRCSPGCSKVTKATA